MSTDTGAVDLDAVLSGQSGTVAGLGRLRAGVVDLSIGLGIGLTCRRAGIDRHVRQAPPRTIAVLSIYRPQHTDVLRRALAKLADSHHRLEFVLGSLGPTDPSLKELTKSTELKRGKFHNLNELLGQIDHQAYDWTIVLDDDVELPGRFLDRFIFLAERFDFELAQPALTHTSHAAWTIFRRRAFTLARRTQFVEIGPVTAFSRRAAAELLPFPDLEMGWGLDLYWGHVAMRYGWPVGVVDATAVRHRLRRPAAAYSRAAAEQEARQFLAARPHINREQAQQCLAEYRSL